MRIPSPLVSYWGLPARPNIWRTSRGPSSTQRPFSGLYTCYVRKYNTMYVILRSTSTAQHWRNINGAQLNPATFLWAALLLHKKIQHICHIKVYCHGPPSEGQLNPTIFLWAVHLLTCYVRKIQHMCHIEVCQHGLSFGGHWEPSSTQRPFSGLYTCYIRKYNTMYVILRSTSTAQHWWNIKRAQLNPTTFLWAVHLLHKKIKHICHIKVYCHGPPSEGQLNPTISLGAAHLLH